VLTTSYAESHTRSLPGVSLPQILVIEDDPNIARTLVELLAHHGFDADRADSGEAALERLGQQPFDLVLLDVRLPGMNGFETCVRIREQHGAALPVIMLTAFGDPGSVRRGYDSGADDFLQKPPDTPSLILKVRAFLRLKSLHDEILRNREAARARARDLALLHEIGRDWSLIAKPEDFYRMVTQRLAALIGAPICAIALYDPASETIAPALPVHGFPDEAARGLRFPVKPDSRSRWSFRTGRPYVSNEVRTDSRLLPEVLERGDLDSVVLMPLLSESHILGLLVACNKPGGFTEDDVQILSIFAGPAATFLRSRQIFERERRHSARLERLSALAGQMGAVTGRSRILDLAVARIQDDLGFERVAFYAPEEGGRFYLECEAGPGRSPDAPFDETLLHYAARGATPLRASAEGPVAELAIPVRAGDAVLGVLDVLRRPAAPFDEDEIHLLSTLGGQLALALQRAESHTATERMARQMATLYDLGLETAALRDLRLLFANAAEEAGRLIQADRTAVFRFDDRLGVLRLFASWNRDPAGLPREESGIGIALGEGVIGRVARDRVPAIVDDQGTSGEGGLASRVLCVPLTYYDQKSQSLTLFGVLSAHREGGGPRFQSDDIEYLTRFAGQLAIALANSFAFQAERERSDQLSLVNSLLREIAGRLSPEQIFETTVKRIHEAFPSYSAGIVLPDLEAGVFRAAAFASRESRLPEWSGFPLTQGVLGRAFRERVTQLVDDVSRDPDYRPWATFTKSEVAIPILSGEEVVAVLDIEADVVRAFDQGQVITLETLADGLGIILRNAELFKALEETNARLVELDRTKSELVHIVAHDFRAPLSTILGYAELLEWKPEAPQKERKERAGAIVRAATHMAGLMDKTLTTARLETGHMSFEFGLVDLAELAREAGRRYSGDERHPLVLEIPDYPLPSWADGGRVAEVLDNLVANAVKYSPRGGTVKLRLERGRETAVICVSDQGIGIAPKDRDRLFRPFSRVRDAETAGIDGFGLGLYICERVARAHGGRLTFESEYGTGSTFRFELPLYGADAQGQLPVVLVATQDARTRREVRRVADALGFGTHEAADGLDALEAAIRLVPSAVVLDRVLPHLGALEIADRLAAYEATRVIPIVALAAAEDLGAAADRFSACLPKPVDRGSLEECLRGALRRTPVDVKH
jgi:signal transduction histidine kinase/DNA-binding response OmpR family regulator